MAKQRSFLENLFLGATKPFRQAGGLAQEGAYTIKDIVDLARGQYTGARPEKYVGLSEEESKQLYDDPLKTSTKSAAGVASYAIPGGSKAATTGGRILGAAGKGAVAGGLGGYGASAEDDELRSILTGAGLGSVIGGVTQGMGEGVKAIKSVRSNKVSEKLGELGDDLKTTAYKKRIGTVPTAKQGKYDLVRDSMKLAKKEKFTVRNADDLYNFSEELFSRYGNDANQMAEIFDVAGNTIPYSEVKRPLLDKIASTSTDELKEPLQRVLTSMDNAVGGDDLVSASELLKLKREWGNLGNWNDLTPSAEKSIAQAWEQAYLSADDALEKSLSKVGIKGFKDVNRKLSTAIGQQNWARRAKASRAGNQVWTDMTQDALAFGGALMGGGPGAVGGVAISKLLQNYGEDIAGSTLQGASRLAEGVGDIGGSGYLQQILDLAQRASAPLGAVAGSTGAQVEEQPMQEPMMQQPVPQQSPINEMALLQAVLSGNLSTSEADWIMGMFGGGQVNEEQALLENSINEMERLYGVGTSDTLSAGQKTTGLVGLGAKGVQEFKSAFDQDFADRKTAYDQQKALALGIINKARQAGTLNEGEFETLIANAPNEYSSETSAQSWFNNVRRLLLTEVPQQNDMGYLNSILGL